MLLQFTVGNFKSFREKVTISMEATSDDLREDDNVAHIETPTLRLVKSAAIYGPNAGGKSNLIDAMARFRALVLGSSKDSQKGEPLAVSPFRLNSENENAPTHFEVLFLLQGTRYRYGFEATKEVVTAEWLFEKKESIRETRLFTRDGDEIDPGTVFKEGRGLEVRTRSNALFLSVVAQFNGAIAGEVIGWIDQLMTISGIDQTSASGFTAGLLNDTVFGASIREMVKLADVGIEDLIRVDLDKDAFLASFTTDMQTSFQALFAENPYFASRVESVHRRFNARNEPEGMVQFDFETEESAGTRQFFALSGRFLHALHEGTVLVVDELDARLHPLLTRQLISMFNSSANRQNAQLIFTTHDQGLLDSKRIRRDQVWFVEKDKMGASELFCLAEIKGVRKEANFEKAYLLGQFGGVPHLGDFQGAIVHAEE